MRPIAVLVLLFFSVLPAYSQVDDTVSINKVNDSTFIDKRGRVIAIQSYASRFNPRKALLYSAVFPGMGQVYNKKYWKLPLVYGGFAALIGVAKFYHDQNVEYREDLFTFLSDPTKPKISPLGLTDAQLRSVIDRSRRERDYFIILSMFWYMLQLVDAHVDAHLKEFDVNPNLRVRLEPNVNQNNLTGRTTGVALTLKF
jgi:hypothetical protein